MGLPPRPIGSEPGSSAWDEWYRQLSKFVSDIGTVSWDNLEFSGSNLTDITTRAHSALQGIQGGTASQYYHVTSEQNRAIRHFGGPASAVYASRITDDYDYVLLVDTASADITITLHDDATENKEIEIIKAESANTLTIAGPMNNFTKMVLYLKDSAIKLKYINNIWYIL